MATTTIYTIWLPHMHPMDVFVQREVRFAKPVGKDKAFGPVVSTERSVSLLNMPTPKPAWPGALASEQKAECGLCSEHDRTGTETVCTEKRKKKSVRARIWSRMRKVCGKKTK